MTENILRQIELVLLKLTTNLQGIKNCILYIIYLYTFKLLFVIYILLYTRRVDKAVRGNIFPMEKVPMLEGWITKYSNE